MRDEEADSYRLDGRARSFPHTSSSRGEFDFINSIRHRARHRKLKKTSARRTLPSSLLYGIGDDAAVIEHHVNSDTVVTADLLVEDVDFRLSTITPALLGHKALAVSLSDIAAMGARPRWALISIGVPRAVWRSSFLDHFYDGFFAIADYYGVALIGGDVSRTPERVVIDSIVIGEAAHGHTVFRSGARPGDHLFVTGALGGASAGLHFLEGSARLVQRSVRGRSKRIVDQLILRHLRPEPRVRWGALLGEERLATAMIDLSDGLSSDLAHLCRESGVGAVINAGRIPVDSLVAQLGRQAGLDPLELALNGGEDFELLFTVRPRDLWRLPRALGKVSATYIGDMTYDKERILIREGKGARPLRSQGYTHFR